MNFDESYFIYVIFVIDALVIAWIVFCALASAAIGLFNEIINPVYPHCDIDPLCHPGFVWDKEGNGWIGNCMVKRALS